MGVIASLLASLVLVSTVYCSISEEMDMLKVSAIVLGQAEQITNHRKSLKYMEKYLFPVRKTFVFPNGVKTICMNGLNPVV
jgi:hypothetical protein